MFVLALLTTALPTLVSPPPPLGSKPAPAPQLELPIDCAIGRDCFVQNYVDHDPGKGRRDYHCGSMTYDGLTDTDFRVPTWAAMRAGVGVRAALGGVVGGLLDGVADTPYAEGVDLHNQDCGNGVVVEHPGGWSTIYCHLRNGSVRVKVGDRVETGQPLGLAGESGAAAFVQLGFSVRLHGRPIDPFAATERAGDCKGRSLWSPEAAAALAYASPSVINSGFATGPVTMDAVEGGEIAPPTPSDTAMVAYVRTIGLEAGDVISLTLTAPDGKALATNTAAPLDRAKAQWLTYAGIRRPEQGWPPGAYRALYEVRREGEVAVSLDWIVAF